MNETVKIIARNGIVAALYFALTMLIYPLSFGMIQIRVSEVMVLLCFYRKDYTIGLTIGCAIANLFSGMPLDVLIGSAATLIACLGISFSKHLWVACLFPIVANGLIIGAELYYVFAEASFWVNAGFVALGEFGAMILGYILFFVLRKRTRVLDLLGANQNREFKC